MSPFEINADHEEMRSVVRDFCGEFSSEREVRRVMESETGFDDALWRRLGKELGAFGLAVPTAYGGEGQGLRAQAVVIEEFGAALTPGPVIGVLALAIPLLCALSDEQVKRDLLPGLVSGELRTSFAAPLGVARLRDTDMSVRAERVGDGWRLHGRVDHVFDAATADVIIVAAMVDDRMALFTVRAGAPGLDRTPIPVMDLTRRQATVNFRGCEARLIATGEEARGACVRVFLAAGVLLAAEQVGAAAQLLERTIEYLGTRHQFGRPIGSFQAIKHRCADLLVAVEHARSLTLHAAWVADTGEGDAQLAVSMAQASCSQVFQDLAAAAIQLHGGIGFTWEHWAHLYFKRAVADAALLGSAEQHRQVIAELTLANRN